MKARFYGKVPRYASKATSVYWKNYLKSDPHFAIHLAHEQATEADLPALITSMICGIKPSRSLTKEEPSVSKSAFQKNGVLDPSSYHLLCPQTIEAALYLQLELFGIVDLIGLETDDPKIRKNTSDFIHKGLQSPNCLEATGAALAMRIAPEKRMLVPLAKLIKKTSNISGRLILTQTAQWINDEDVMSKSVALAIAKYLTDFTADAIVALTALSAIESISHSVLTPHVRTLSEKTIPTLDDLKTVDSFIKFLKLQHSDLHNDLSEIYGKLTFVSLMRAIEEYDNSCDCSPTLYELTPNFVMDVYDNPQTKLHIAAIRTLAKLSALITPNLVV